MIKEIQKINNDYHIYFIKNDKCLVLGSLEEVLVFLYIAKTSTMTRNSFVNRISQSLINDMSFVEKVVNNFENL